MILLLALALFAARQFLVPQMDTAAIAPDPPTGVQDEGGDDSLVEPEAAPAGDVSAEGEPLEAARRIVHVPGNAVNASEQSPDFDSWSVDDEHLEAYAKHNLERALSNDLAAAFRIEIVQKRCREAPGSLAELDQHVERQILMYGMFRDKQTDFTPPDALEIRQRNLDKFAGCQFFKGLFNNDLRERLADLAGQGHVAARYLYAMWPPSVKGRADAFFVQQEWAEKALAFSLANLAEGEVAGLMAFAHAYQKAGSFTTYDQELGMAFQIAAQDCGLDMPILVTSVEHFLSDENFPPFREDTRPAVLAMAEGLKGLCIP